MAAMKDLFTDLQEQIYKKLKNLGVSQETILSFEDLLTNSQQGGLSFFDFAEKMAGYAMTINIFSQTTEYDRKRLWSIWLECVQDFVDGDEVYDSLDKEWESFKRTTRERDW